LVVISAFVPGEFTAYVDLRYLADVTMVRMMSWWSLYSTFTGLGPVFPPPIKLTVIFDYVISD